ncbi:MAG: quinolinate synthase NadA [Candidatus Peribacteraceae bacterium]|nr:quinolinate synthase NadA [Candidatus Peribacteraceae bacterium]
MQSRIRELKSKKNAVILAHSYQLPEIYDVADAVADSFELAVAAQKTKAAIIVFAGVHFMAESAKLLNPKKKVLLPDREAGCFLADCVTVEKLREKKKARPEAGVVAYVNSTAAVKAESDACCTSANAIEICRKLPQKQIIFVPDGNLGEWVGENLPEKEIITWPGSCYVHARISEEKVLAAQKLHPEAKILVHPESPKKIRALADLVAGTGGMSKFVKNSAAKEFLIGTESGMLEKLRRENFIPAEAGTRKKFFALAGECINMKKITLEKVLNSLKNEEFEIKVDAKTAAAARHSLQKMIDLSTTTAL